MLQEFRDFALKGNLIEIAIGLVLALAFTAVVGSFVDDIVMPILGVIVGERSFDDLTWEIGDGVIQYGAFIEEVIYFALVAAALFFGVVKPYNMLRERQKSGEEPSAPEREDLVLLRQIAENTGR